MADLCNIAAILRVRVPAGAGADACACAVRNRQSQPISEEFDIGSS